jgi:hypothetical protein
MAILPRSRGAFFAPELCFGERRETESPFRRSSFPRERACEPDLPEGTGGGGRSIVIRVGKPSKTEKKQKKDAERRHTLYNNLRTFRCGSRLARRARLSAFHRGSRQRESSSLRLSFRPGFLGRGLNGRYPPSPVPVQRSTSRPGHNAGRLMPKPPGSERQIRPRAPPSPDGPVCLRNRLLHKGEETQVIDLVTNVKGRVT